MPKSLTTKVTIFGLLVWIGAVVWFLIAEASTASLSGWIVIGSSSLIIMTLIPDFIGSRKTKKKTKQKVADARAKGVRSQEEQGKMAQRVAENDDQEGLGEIKVIRHPQE